MIRLNGASKSYGPIQAVADVSLEILPGQAIAVQGPSGSGKSTLLRLIAGLEPPDQGEILEDGQVVARPGWTMEPFRRRIGFVFQEPALWPHMTVADNIAFALREDSRRERRCRLASLLEQCGIAHLARRYPHQISGGEAARTAIARALAPRPRTLLLDEPLAHLDEALRASHLELIRQSALSLHAHFVYVTHDREEAVRLGGRIARMCDGRLAL